MGDFPVVMFDEDTTEPEKIHRSLPEKKKKLHTSSRIFPFLQGSMASPPQKCGNGLCALVDTNRLVDLRCPAMSGCLALRCVRKTVESTPEECD